MKSYRVWLPLAAGIVFFVTMPAFIYPGDNFAPIAEASYLLKRGKLGIPYGERHLLSFFLEARGQYFFENDAHQRMFSKYGIGNTLLYLPSCGVSRMFTGNAPLDTTDKGNFLLVVNIYNLAFAVLAVIYLLRIAELYTARKSHSAAFAVLSVFATYLWHYLRAPALEIYQIPLFLAAYYHLVRFLRTREDAEPAWKHLAAATVSAGMLALLKTFFVVLLPVIWLCALSTGKYFGFTRGGFRAAAARLFGGQALLALVLPTVLAAGILGFSNYYRFGSCFASGYDQWLTPAGVPHDRFSAAFIPQAVRGFFFARGNHNVFLHYPLLLVALAGLPRFCRRHPREAGLIYGICFCLTGIVCMFSAWTGEICYGPRYLVHAAIIAALPSIEALELMRERIRSAAGLLFAAAAGALLAVSAKWQMNVSSCHYLVVSEVQGLFSSFEREKIEHYFNSTWHYGIIVGDLIDHANGKKGFYPMCVLALDPELKDKNDTLARLDAVLRYMARPNYYFLFQRDSPPAPPVSAKRAFEAGR